MTTLPQPPPARPGPRRRNRLVAAGVGALLAAALTVVAVLAVRADREPAAAIAAAGSSVSPSSVPASSPAADKDREACHLVSLIGDDAMKHFEAAVMQPIALAATQAKDPAIVAAGTRIAHAFQYGEPDPGDESLEAMSAALALAEACAARYGDGPW